MRPRDSLALALALSMVLGLRPAAAYDDVAHRQIVADAFEFMLSERKSTAPYADGATGVSDFQLLQRTLAKNTSQPDAELRGAASTLAQGVVDTDRLPDLTLNVAGLGDSTDFLGRVSFTLFSHFVNVHAPGTLWTESGYSWRWVESNQKCSHSNLEDHFSNFFSGRYPATLVLAKSPVAIRYRGALRSGITESDYTRQMAQELKAVEFWPLTNLAQYWYDEFVRSASDQGKVYNLAWIAPVLHAVADATVPYHAAGISGCGHRTYEAAIETLSKQHQLYRPQTVRELLQSATRLKRNASVRDIILAVAREAASSQYCRCNVGACDCEAAAASPKPTGGRLVNVAVASTVIVLRKALAEWEHKRDTAHVSDGLLLTPFASVQPRVKTASVKKFGLFPSIKADTADLSGWNVDVVGQGIDGSTEKDMAGRLRTLNHVVAGYPAGRYSVDQFSKSFDVAVNFLASGVAENTDQWQSLSAPPEEQQFRPPTVEEVVNAARWQKYRQERQAFYGALTLYQGGISLAVLKSQLADGTPHSNREALELSKNAVLLQMQTTIKELGSHVGDPRPKM